MANKIKSKCCFNFCTNKADYFGRCAKHKHEVKSGTKEAYDNNWAKASRAFLMKNPLCVKCLENNRAEPATVVDHKIPLKRGGPKWRWENLAALCVSCHGLKRSYEIHGRPLDFYKHVYKE